MKVNTTTKIETTATVKIEISLTEAISLKAIISGYDAGAVDADKLREELLESLSEAGV